MKNNITVKSAIDKVNIMMWDGQKDGHNSLRNAKVFSKWHGSPKFMNDVSTETVREYKFYQKNKLEYKPGTINRKLAALSKLVTYVSGCKGFTFNWGRPIIEYDRTNNRRKFTVSIDVEDKLINKTIELGYKDKADLWIFLIDVGCRVGESLKLRWEQIDLENGFVKFFDTSQLIFLSSGLSSEQNFEFLKLISPFVVNALPFLPNLVGRTQSNISTPLSTDSKISIGLPTPIK